MKEPVQFGCVINLNAGTATSSPPECAPVVPPDKSLVIEFITIKAVMPKGQVPEVLIQTTGINLGAPGTTQNNYFIAFNSGPLSPTSATDTYFATHQVKMRAMPGDDIGLSVARNSTSGQATFSISYGGILVSSS
jgi:hypothetical protein